jgi:PleD family two-component response regulator
MMQENQNPTVILLDLNMTVVSGMECLQELKKQDRLATIPVVVYSTADNAESQDKAGEYGAAAYLIKPGTINEIKTVVEGVLNKLHRHE